MDAIEHKDPSKSIPKKKAKKKAPPKKKKEEDEDAEESSPKEEVEKPKPKTKSKNEFLDSVLESTISNKKTSSESSKLNSFEKQQQDENDVWASIAKDGPDAITGDDDEPKKKTKKAKNKMMQWRSINQQCRMRMDCKGAIECFDYYVKQGLTPDTQILATILSNADPEESFSFFS